MIGSMFLQLPKAHKKILEIVSALLVFTVLIVLYNVFHTSAGAGTSDPRYATYVIEDTPVTLINGYAEVSVVSGSASKVVIKYFGNKAIGDVNGDGLPDTAFILTGQSGGSGTFYYVVVAVKNSKGYIGTNAVFLGDRIAPQTTEIKNGTIVVNYAVRKTGQPMTAAPTVGVSKYLKIINGKLVTVKR